MNQRKWTVLGIFLLIILLSFLGMKLMIELKNENIPPLKETAKKAVKTKKVNYTKVESEVIGLGRVQSLQKVDIIAEVSGKILPGSVSFKKGQHFEKGDVLVKIYSDEFRFTLQSRKSRFLNMVANILPDIKIDFTEEYSSWDSFFLNIKIDKPMPELPELNDPKIKIFLASKNILSEYYGIKSDEERLKKYTIIAPFDGYLTNVMLESGSVANPGSHLGQMIRTGKLELEIPLSIQDAELVRIGDDAVIYAEKNKQPIAKGIVTREAGYIDPSTQTLSLFVSIRENNANLYEGQYYSVTFPGKVFKSAMVIPRNAVFNTNEVFIVADSTLKKLSIDILKINSTELLFNGVDEGTEIVIEPLINVKEGTAVSVINNLKRIK